MGDTVAQILIASATAIIGFVIGLINNKINLKQETKKERVNNFYIPFVKLYDSTHMAAAYNFLDFSEDSPVIFSRIDRRKFVEDRFKIAFLIPFLISMLSLLTNFLLAQIVFSGGRSMSGLEQIETQGFLEWSIQNPNLAYIGYILVYSLIAGGYGIACTGVSFLFPNNKIAYAIVFFLWIVQIISPYSLTYAMQPFIEYGPEYFIPALVIFVAFVVGIYGASYRYKVKFDEI